MSDITGIPPLRADAQRNRDAILRAAREVFAESGVTAPLELIAKRAGVGRATLYRRFPTRDALVAAIFEADMDELHRIARRDGDPALAFFAILEHTLELQRRNPAVLEIFTTSTISKDVVQHGAIAFEAFLEQPLREAQAAGLVRADLEVKDVGTLLIMIAATGPALRTDPGAERWRARAWQLLHDAIDPARAPRALVA